MYTAVFGYARLAALFVVCLGQSGVLGCQSGVLRCSAAAALPGPPAGRNGPSGLIYTYSLQTCWHSSTGMSCPGWQWHRTGSRWSPVRTLPVAPLWCDLGFFPNSRGNKAAANLRPREKLEQAKHILGLYQQIRERNQTQVEFTSNCSHRSRRTSGNLGFPGCHLGTTHMEPKY